MTDIAVYIRKMAPIWLEIAEDGPEGNEPLGLVVRTAIEAAAEIERLSSLLAEARSVTNKMSSFTDFSNDVIKYAFQRGRVSAARALAEKLKKDAFIDVPTMQVKAAKDMTPDEREAELTRIEARIVEGFGERGGSPGEWWYERADELRYWIRKEDD